MEILLECSNISKHYGQIKAVNCLNLSLEKGQHYALLGPSGCGKTTTLRIIAGLEKPKNGKIILREKIVNDPDIKVPPEERRLGMVFQNLALWPHMTVEKNLTFGLSGLANREKLSMAKARLDIMGLGHRSSAYPHQLSEGERQRVALARAIINKPDFLILDEPVANLDRPLKTALLHQIADIARKEGVTMLFVTHDQADALSFADRLLIMKEGRIEQEGSPQDLYTRPASPFSGFLLGYGAVVEGRVKGGTIFSPLGIFSLAGQNINIENGEGYLFLRPEDIRLSSSDNGLKGVVLGGRYEGGRWLWEVDIKGNVIPLWASVPPSTGDPAWVEFINPPFPLQEEWKKE